MMMGTDQCGHGASTKLMCERSLSTRHA